jgi:hypothetical protein
MPHRLLRTSSSTADLKEDPVGKHLIYCSACDREVAIVIESAPDAEESDNTLMNVVCTEIGENCTGLMCPICAKPSDQMREELLVDDEW